MVKLFNLRDLVDQWFEQVEVRDRKIAKLLCQSIPASCPFERDIKLFGRTLFHIPPLCKLNPFYEQLVSLRFKALSYLTNESDKDKALYCY